MLSFIDLRTTDPAFNLAAEQYVFDVLPKDRTWFLLWQNDNAVIIGKHQNTLAEINPDYIQKNHVKVVRRLSGGGAVYHDMGNLNFTFIAESNQADELDFHLFCQPVIRALSRFGVTAELNGRNDMTIDGKKFSGNSQYIKNGRVMHHGTIMFDSNLDVVDQALKVDEAKIKAKGIKSVRSRVTNVLEHMPVPCTLDAFRNALVKEVLSEDSGSEYTLSDSDIAEIRKIAEERYSTWEWNYGMSPKCEIVRSQRIEGCGTVQAYLTLENGMISSVVFRGDFFSAVEPEKLSEKLQGVALEKEALYTALKNTNISRFFKGLSTEELVRLLLL